MNDKDLLTIILGWTAIILSLTYRIPQIYKIYKTKSGTDVSKRAIFIQSLSYLIWLFYAILVNDIFFIIANILSFIQNILMLILKYKYSE